MKIKSLTLLSFLFVGISICAQQEKRLALVIGNANYDKGALDNPVNDALLMEKTLKSLDFDVILDTNIATLQEFNSTVRKFGDKRDEYNVGFIYYAGHGVQINGENYLLATKEKYASEYDVDDNALSVQKIMRYLTNKTNQVNVLILDACRDNPFEQNWNPQTRSIAKGQGLAKISPPAGSLIAFSTDAGETAADGEGNNSIYCLSLSRYMQIPNLTLQQVFNNVRTEVLKETNGKQSTVEHAKLTGQDFYLKKGTYTDDFILIDSLIEDEKYEKGLEIAISVLNEDKNNKSALIRKGRLYDFLGNYKLANEALDLALKLFPNDAEVFMYRGRFYLYQDEFDKALLELNKAIETDSTYADAFKQRGRLFEIQEKFELALADYTKAIALDPENPLCYSLRAYLYETLDEENKAFTDYSKAIELDPENAKNWYNRGDFHYNYLHDKEALSDFEEALKINPSNVDAINAIGVIYEEQGKIDLAIETYERGIALEETAPESAAYCYRNRAAIYETQEKFNLALADYTKAIALDPENPLWYSLRANLYVTQDEENKALIDYSKAIEKDPNNEENWYNRGVFHYNHFQYKEALDDMDSVLKINPANVNAINYKGVIFGEQGNINKEIETYETGIALEKTNPESAAMCYFNRGLVFENQEKLDEAISDYSKAIALDGNTSSYYASRGILYDFIDKVDSAFLDFNKAIEINPTNSECYKIRGDSYYSNDKPELALLDYLKSFSFDSIQPETETTECLHVTIGWIYVDLGLPDQALLYYNKGIALELSHPIIAADCYSSRAELFDKQEQYNEAVSDLNKSVELDPSDAWNIESRAILHEKLENYNKAFNDYDRAIRLMPDEKYFRTNRINLLNQLDMTEELISDYEELLKLDTTDIGPVIGIGNAYYKMDDYDKAAYYYSKGTNYQKSDPTDAAICYHNLGMIAEKEQPFDEAFTLYKKALSLDSNNLDMILWHAAIYEGLKNYEKAYKLYSRAINLDVENPEYYEHRAILSQKSKDYASTKKDFKQALKISPEDTRLISIIGLFYAKQNEFKKSFKLYNDAISKNPEEIFAYNYRARTHLLLSDTSSALYDFKKSKDIDPDNPESYYEMAKIYQAKAIYYRATIFYTKAIHRLGVESEYYVTDDYGAQMSNHKIYLARAECHIKMQESEFACEDYQKALELMKDEPFYMNKEKDQKALEEKIKTLCN